MKDVPISAAATRPAISPTTRALVRTTPITDSARSTATSPPDADVPNDDVANHDSSASRMTSRAGTARAMPDGRRRRQPVVPDAKAVPTSTATATSTATHHRPSTVITVAITPSADPSTSRLVGPSIVAGIDGSTRFIAARTGRSTGPRSTATRTPSAMAVKIAPIAFASGSRAWARAWPAAWVNIGARSASAARSASGAAFTAWSTTAVANAVAPPEVSSTDTTDADRLLAVPAVHHPRVRDIARNARQPARIPARAVAKVRMRGV